MRILQVFTPASAGGLESVVEMLAPGLQSRGLEVGVTAVLIGDSPEPPSVIAIRASGVPVFIHRQEPRGYLAEWRAHRERVRAFGAEVVHTHGYRADVLAGYAAGRTNKVTTVHGFTGGDWKNRLYERLQIRAYRNYGGVIAVSNSVAARLGGQGVGQSKLVVVPNAWSSPVPPMSRAEARSALGISPDAKVVGWVGRLSAEKGCDVLLDAVAQLKQSAVHFSIIGDGSERRALEAQADRLGVGDRVTWHGLMPGAGRLMAAFDLFVLSSRTEGTPIALFEAMGAGVPVVATAVGGVPDVISTNEGWLIPPESPALLAQAIQAALNDAGESRLRSTRAADRLRRDYAPVPWLDRHLDLYSRLIAGKSPSTS